MDELKSILEQVDAAVAASDFSAMSDEQLTEAADKITAYGKSLASDKPTDQEITDIITLGEAVKAVKAELSIREVANTERKAKADEALAAFGEPDPVVEEVVEEPVLEPVTASRPSAAEVAKRRPPQAEPKQDDRPKALVAAALDGEGRMGTRFEDRDELAQAMSSTWDHLSNGSQTVARIPIKNRYSLGDNEITNFNVLMEVQAGTQKARNEDVALTAALGCAPSEPIYEFCSMAVRGAGLVDLPTVTARRGSRTYPPSVSFPSISGQAGIGSQFTGATKSCFTVPCGTVRTTDVIANYICLTFDNDEGLFYPEMVAHYNELALVAWEHAVNQRIIENMRDNVLTTTVQDLDTGGGTVIGLVRALLRTRAYYIERHKMSENAVLDAVLPFWFASAYAVDIATRQSTDMATSINLGLGRIESELRQGGINAQFVYDWQQGPAAGYDDFGSALLYAPGHFVRLDGPTLDLGVVRDSTLNAANDFQIFFEGWTGLAAVCDEALYIQGIETCPTGQAALTTAITCGAS